MIKQFIHIIFLDQNGYLQIYQFEEEDRLERALRFCQGLIDEGKAYFMREFEEVQQGYSKDVL